MRCYWLAAELAVAADPVEEDDDEESHTRQEMNPTREEAPASGESQCACFDGCADLERQG